MREMYELREIRKLIKGLRAQKILQQKDIFVLKDHIQRRYPGYSPKKRATILENKIYRIIDDHMPEFDEEHRARIRFRLVNQADIKNNYNIYGDDIFRICLAFEVKEKKYIQALTSWVNRYQKVPLSSEILLAFFTKARQNVSDLMEHDLDLALKRLEEMEAKSVADNAKPDVSFVGALNIPSVTLAISKPHQVEKEILEPIPTALETDKKTEQPTLDDNIQLHEVDKEFQKDIPKNLPARDWNRSKALVAPLIVLSALSFQPLKNMRSPMVIPPVTNEAEANDAVEAKKTINMDIESVKEPNTKEVITADGGRTTEVTQLKVVIELTEIKEQKAQRGSTENKGISNPLPRELRYTEIDQAKLRDWLNNRNSILADEPYFSTIINTAKEYNINPLLLIAITGKEQSFVPRNDKDAKKIANNPFNVYRSWQEYNTNIHDSTKIAAITIVNLSQNRPEAIDPIVWINRRYAEDKNWSKGVSYLLRQLNKEVREVSNL